MPDCQISLLMSSRFWLAAKLISCTAMMLKEENKFWHGGGEKNRLFAQPRMVLETDFSLLAHSTVLLPCTSLAFPVLPAASQICYTVMLLERSQ